MWNNNLRLLWNLMLAHQVKWNKSTHAHRHFTWRSHISRAKRISQIPQGIYFVEKSTCRSKCFFHGRGWGIRTPANGVRVRCATVTQILYIPLGNAPIIPNLSEMSRTISGNLRIFFWLLICCRQKETAPYFSGLRGGVFPIFPTGNFLLLNLRDSHGMLLNI